MTTTPTFTLVLIDWPDGTWSAEPVNMAAVAGYTPDHAGPHGCYRRSADLGRLIHHDMRDALAAALGVDRLGFDLRFCAPSGECVARSEVLPGRVLVYATPELRQRARLQVAG